MKTNLRELASQIGIMLSDDQIQKLMNYKNLLQQWNQVMNLTAITEDYEIILKHFIDSFTIQQYLPQNASLIDVGTGAGFPGLAIKMIRDDLTVTLLDSLNKRITFLDGVIEKNSLQQIQTVHGRAEDYGQNKNFRESYDVAVARAVANLSTLAEYCLPFVKVGGKMIAMKGSNLEEIEGAEKAIAILGGKIQTIHTVVLPSSEITHTIVEIQKIKATPNVYPRKAGKPSTNPL